MTLTPLLKVKVDELFLRWLSNAETQRQLRQDLQLISEGSVRPLSPVVVSPSNRHGYSLALSGTQGPPPSSPTSLKSPRSPRRRSSSLPNKSPTLQRTPSILKEQEQKTSVPPGCAQHFPQFYFPNGRPKDESEIKQTLQLTKSVFNSLPNHKASLDQFSEVLKVADIPKYWRKPLYSFCGGTDDNMLSFSMFSDTWTRLTKTCHDNESRFLKIAAQSGNNYLIWEDFDQLIQDIVSDHPGLQCLREAPEFHSVYKLTVISRIFYAVNRSWSGRITLPELRRSNFLEVLSSLEKEEDINQILDYFSYEHFYVIYCKFWELDTDHDLVIDEKDLARYCNGALSQRLVKRIFSGCVTRGKLFKENKMEYSDFVWFLISEVDKKNPTGVEYWFRCMDIDGDGFLSMYELEYFYEEQIEKMERLSIEVLTFRDCLCQILDMVKPKCQEKITLQDLKACRLAFNFFDTFLNLDRWLEFEQRDPFQSLRESDLGIPLEDMSDWDKFAMVEYDLLVAEEGNSQERDYDDDFEFDDDLDAEDLELLKGGLDQISEEMLSNACIAAGGDQDNDDSFFR